MALQITSFHSEAQISDFWTPELENIIFVLF